MHFPSRTRHRVALVLIVVAVLSAWLGVRALQIRHHLLAAGSALGAATSGGVDGALRAGDRATREVDAARAASRDPLWRLVGAVPLLGRSFSLASKVADISHTLVHESLPPLSRVLKEEQSSPLIQSGRVDLARLTATEPPLSTASRTADSALKRAEGLPRTYLPGLDRQRRAFIGQVKQLAGVLRDAHTAVDLAPAMLGADGPRRYFLAVQNNAESRATGGLIGAYAILRADHGKIIRERVGTDQDFVTADQPVVDLGPDFAQHYDQDAARVYWSSAVLTPDWPSAGAIIAGLWQAQGGAPIDGVIGIDPIAMSDLLRATGPVTLANRRITAANVVDFVMRDEYAEFVGREEERKQALRELAGKIFDGVLGGGSNTSLVTAFATAGSSGHLQLWSRRPAEQSRLDSHRLGGALPADRGAFLEVVTQNGAGNKIDYYLRRKVTYSRPAPRVGKVELTVRNLVDPAKVPPIVTGRLDGVATRPGETKLLLTFYASVGATVRDVTVDGEAVPFETGTEKGHGYGYLRVLVAPDHPVTVVALMDDPGGPLTYRQQPLVVDDELAIKVPRSSRR